MVSRNFLFVAGLAILSVFALTSNTKAATMSAPIEIMDTEFFELDVSDPAGFDQEFLNGLMETITDLQLLFYAIPPMMDPVTYSEILGGYSVAPGDTFSLKLAGLPPTGRAALAANNTAQLSSDEIIAVFDGFDGPAPSPVPLPAGIWLLGSGVMLLGARRVLKRSA